VVKKVNHILLTYALLHMRMWDNMRETKYIMDTFPILRFRDLKLQAINSQYRLQLPEKYICRLTCLCMGKTAS